MFGRENQKCCFKLCIKHPNEEVKQAAGSKSLEIRKKVWTKDVNFSSAYLKIFDRMR